ncbi:MAG: hypothetical protein IME96_10970 [Proteobacteria bacterium]|nr:hypothetical protein [Pseudomonadota bacterium]
MKHLDTSCKIIIVITFVVFGAALFTEGFIHDLLLELGVLLISVKLIMLAYKNGEYVESLQKDLRDIKELLEPK